MGIISDFFSSFSRSGAQVTRDIQSVAQRGRVVRRAPTTRPRTRGAGISRIKRRAISSVDRLSKTQSARFVTTQATRIDQAIKREAKEHIPTLRDIQMAGYRYGQKNPEAARLIYGSGNFGAGVVRKAIPKDVGVPVGQAMYAFSDGAIHGVRNDPVKALAFVALPGAVGVVVKGAKYIPIASKIVKSEKAMKAAAYGFDIVYSHNVYTRVNAPVVSYYKDGKVLSETSKKMPDGSIQITQKIEQVPVMRKPNTNEKSERLGYIFSTEAGPMVFGAMGMHKVSKTRFQELSRKKVATTKKKVRSLKRGMKEFAKAERAEVQIMKKKKKKKKQVQKLELVQKPKTVTKEVEVVDLRQYDAAVRSGYTPGKIIMKMKKGVKFKDPILESRKIEKLSIEPLIKSKTAMTKLEQRAALLKEAKARAGIKPPKLKQRELLEFEKATPESLKHVDLSIEQQIKQLNSVKVIVTKKSSKTKIMSIVKNYTQIKVINSSLRAEQKQLSKLYSQLKTLLNFKSTTLVKSKIKNIVKSITSHQHKIIFLLKQRAEIITKTRTKIITIQKTKEVTRAITLLRTSQKQIPQKRLKTKLVTKKPPKKPPKKPTTKKPPKKPPRRPPIKPPKKPPVMPPLIPPIPVIPIKRKVKPKKKKKKPSEKARAYRIKNPIPTLATFLK